MSKPRIAFVLRKKWKNNCFSEEHIKTLESFAEIDERVYDNLDEEKIKDLVKDADGIITSWETPKFTDDILAASEKLKIVCNCAGTARIIFKDDIFAKVLDRGIAVTTTGAAIGIGVAEFNLGLIIMGVKKIFFMKEGIREGKWKEYTASWRDEPSGDLVPNEPYGLTVGVIGGGFCGAHLIKLLNNFDMRVLLYDPYKNAEQCRALGAEKTELEYLMENCDVISVNTPETPETDGMLNAGLLKKIKDGALLVNTAKASAIDEEALIGELSTGRFFACIDQTVKQPAPADHPFRNMPNVMLTPHIAGHVSNGFKRQGKFAVDELGRFFRGEKLRFGVRKEQLSFIS